MQIDVTVQDANNILCEVTPPQPQIIVIDRGVEGNGIVSIVPVTISTFQYLRITYTNGTVQDVGPLTSTAYTATAPITIVGNTISLATVPIASGGTDATTAAGAIQNLLPSYTGNGNKRLGLNSLATALEWVLDGGGTVTSVAASGGTTGLTFTGSPITTSGTLTLGGTLAVANGGTGVTSSTGTGSVVLSTSPTLVTPVLGTPTSGNFSTGTFTWPTFNQNTTGTAANITATSNSTLTTLSALSLPGSQVSGNISGNAANVTGVVAIANGGTGQTTANAALNALLPTQTGNASKYLQTDGTNATWDAISLSTADITGILPTANGGTGLSSFTANGVVYASSTSALTTGSALTFNGTSLGVGATTLNYRLEVGSTSDSTNSINIKTSTTGTSNLFFSDTNNGQGGITYNHTSDYMRFLVADAEQMRMTTTGLGIGTSSPVSPLTVAGTASVNWVGGASSTGTATIGTQGTGGSLLVQTPSVNASYASGFGVDGTYSVGKSVINLKALGTFSGGPYSADMAFFTSTNTTLSEKMRLDSSGNLGLGVTPSAWTTPFKVFQLGTYGQHVAGQTNTADLKVGTNNHYNGTSYVYTVTGFGASQFNVSSGSYQWNIAPSGTAGNAVSWTQAMTLGSSGDLLLGTTTNRLGEKLHVLGNGIVTSSAENTNMGLFGTFGSSNLIIGAFSNLPVEFRQNNTERMRLDSSGNLLLGLSSALTNGKLQIAGGIGLSGNTQIRQATNGDGNTLQLFATQVVVGVNNGTSYSYTGGGLLASLASSASAITLDVGGTTAGHRLQVVNDGTGSSGTLNYSNAGTSRFYVNSSTGFVGIGTSTVGAKLEVYDAGTFNARTSGINVHRPGSYGQYGSFAYDSNAVFFSSTYSGAGAGSYGQFIFQAYDSTSTAVERARIDSSGNLLVAKTASGLFTQGLQLSADSIARFSKSGNACLELARLDGDGVVAYFYRVSGSAVGSISVTASATAYNTSSDYRLKNTIAPMTGALAKVAQLKPVTYKWNADGSDGEGFIAHELAEVVPQAVTGEKDAVDKNGNPKYQGIDVSFLVATLTAAIQEQQAIIESLKARLDAANL